jgi:hypothetical protein
MAYVTIPRAGVGGVFYAAFRLSGTCTGCSPGFSPIAGWTLRQTKIINCLRAVLAAPQRAAAQLNGMIIPMSQLPKRVALDIGPASVDHLPPENLPE